MDAEANNLRLYWGNKGVNDPSECGAPEFCHFPTYLFHHTVPRYYCLPQFQIATCLHLWQLPLFASGTSCSNRCAMATIDRQQLDHLERRGLQLTIFSAVFVFILAGGLATFMYPLVFVHPEGNKWTLRAAFFGFCALTILFISYLFDRQRSFTKIKQQLLSELERNVELQIQASADLLQSMPNQNHFWDRLTMEFRRALSMEKTLSLILVKARPGAKATLTSQQAALSDAAKALSRKMRPSDSLYRLSDDLFGLVLPETDTLNAKRIALRLNEELQSVRAHYGSSFDLAAHNYPDHVKSSHELEDIVKSMLPEKEGWDIPAEAPVG